MVHSRLIPVGTSPSWMSVSGRPVPRGTRPRRMAICGRLFPRGNGPSRTICGSPGRGPSRITTGWALTEVMASPTRRWSQARWGARLILRVAVLISATGTGPIPVATTLILRFPAPALAAPVRLCSQMLLGRCVDVRVPWCLANLTTDFTLPALTSEFSESSSAMSEYTETESSDDTENEQAAAFSSFLQCFFSFFEATSASKISKVMGLLIKYMLRLCHGTSNVLLNAAFKSTCDIELQWLQSIKYLLTHNGIGDVFLDPMLIVPNFGKTFVQRLNDRFQHTWKNNMHTSSWFMYSNQCKNEYKRSTYLSVIKTHEIRNIYTSLWVNMNILASCKYRQPSVPVWWMCQAGVEDLAHFILICPTWHHLRSEFFRSVQVFSTSNGQQLRKIKLHTGSYMSIGGSQ